MQPPPAHTRRDAPVPLTQADQQGLPRVRSVSDAAVTITASNSPRVSTTMCRLRPLTFFPPSKPLLEAGTAAAPFLSTVLLAGLVLNATLGWS